MSRINDSFTPGGLGILAPQDHGDLASSDAPHFRSIAAGVRVIDRLTDKGEGLQWVEDPETRGDYSGFWYWDRDKDSRPIGSWREAFAVLTPRKEGPITYGGGPGGEITPGSRTPFGATAGGFEGVPMGGGTNNETIYGGVRKPGAAIGGDGFDMAPCPARDIPFTEPRVFGFPILSEEFDEDRRYAHKDVIFPPGLAGDAWPSMPGGGVTLAVAGTSESSQEELFLHVDPRLVAPHVGGSPFHGSIVSDLTAKGDFDDRRTARLQTLMRVIRDPSGNWSWSGGRENTLALNIGKTGLDDGNGGLVADVCDSQIRLGHLSVRDGGFLDVGGGDKDDHVYAQDSDGNWIHPAHLSGLALWRIHKRDGPMLFDRDPYEIPHKFPYYAETFLRWDRGAPYMLPRDAPSAGYSGMWRWETKVPIGSTEGPQTPNTLEPEHPNPVTPGGGGGPTTGGGGGGGGPPTGGGPGGENYNVANGSYVGGGPRPGAGPGNYGTTYYPNDGLGIGPPMPWQEGPFPPASNPIDGGDDDDDGIRGGLIFRYPPATPYYPGDRPPDDGGGGEDEGGGGVVPEPDKEPDDGDKGGAGGTEKGGGGGLYRQKDEIKWGPGGWGPDGDRGKKRKDRNKKAREKDKPPRPPKPKRDGPKPPGAGWGGGNFSDPFRKGRAKWDPRGFWVSSLAASIISADDPNNLIKHTLITHRELALPGISIKPQFIREGELDLRYTTHPGSDGMYRVMNDSPVTLRIEGFGKQEPGSTEWSFVQTPGDSRSRGGIGLGGVAFLQPGLDMSDSLNSFANESASLSHVVMGPGVNLSFGMPDTAAGAILNGISMSRDGAGDMSWAKYDAAGAITTDILKLSSAGVLTATGKVKGDTLATAQTETYSVTNVTPTRSYDAPTASLAEVADALGTLIDDLRNGKLPA